MAIVESTSLPPVDVEARLLAIGNEEDEPTRYQLLSTLLQELQQQEASDASFADVINDIEVLLPVVDEWANGREKYWLPGDQESAGEGGYLGGFFVLRVFPNQQEGIYPPAVDDDSLLFPLWSEYRGKMLIWAAIENNFLTEQFFQEGFDRLSYAASIHQENTVLPIYLGQSQLWPIDELPSNTPLWVQQQHVMIAHLLEIIDYWRLHRQAPDGQFGGGWGDDVEMWRWWSPFLLAFDATAVPDIATSQRLLAEGIFELPRLADGYTSTFVDVEHSSEDTADSITPMLHLFPDDEVWQQRAQVIGQLFADVWTAHNDRGMRQFQSTYFTASEVDDAANHACDTPYHTRALQPFLFLWQNQAFENDALLAWLQTWNDAILRENNSKPAGVPPAAIRYPTGDVYGSPWYSPGCHYSDTTFRFPRAFSMLGNTMVLAAHQTGDVSYMNGLASMAEQYRLFSAGDISDEGEGSLGWALQNIRSHLIESLSKHWLLSQSTEYLDILHAEGNGYVQYRLSLDEELLHTALEPSVQALSVNRVMYTSEVRFTDRVLKFHSKYFNDIAEQRISGVSTELLYNMLTGDLGSAGFFPLPAVKWRFSPRDLRANVKSAGSDKIEVDLYNVAAQQISGAVQILRFTQGDYRFSCEDEMMSEGSFESTISLTLPAQTVCTLIITG